MIIKNLFSSEATIALFSIIFLVTACHKENTSFDYTEAVETVGDYVESQQMTDLLLTTYFKALNDSILLTDSIAVIDGAAITLSSNPATLLFNYNNVTGTDGYGHYRKGSFTATTPTSFTEIDEIIDITFTNFTYDFDTIISEKFSILNKESNNETYVFDITIENMSRIFSDTTGSIIFNASQNFTKTKDPSSIYNTNSDYFEISGTLSGIARNNKAFSSSITESELLKFDYLCRWLHEGSASVDLIDFTYNAFVNFSNGGQCLNSYSILTNETLFKKSFDKE